MHVHEAVATRHSVRAFLDTPVDKQTIERILQRAAQSPSGGNLQPWKVYVLGGEKLKSFVAKMQRKLTTGPGETPEYMIYPPKLKEPYRSRRFKCGEDLYASINIAREDKVSRFKQFENNFRFFGAPIGLFFALDRCMQEGQWSDMGMYIQTLMLLAREEGLHSCAQEAWSVWPQTIREYFNMPDELILFCGLALGYKDESAAINQWRTERAPQNEIIEWHGI